MAIAIVLVGHTNWGKSLTLKALTRNVAQYRYWKISGKDFFIKRMSNDDFSEELKELIETLSPEDKANVILTLCPDFIEPRKYTEQNISTLSSKYKVFFFVLQYKYGENKEVSPDEIKMLEKYGEVKLYNSKNAQAADRAMALKEYIEAVISSYTMSA